MKRASVLGTGLLLFVSLLAARTVPAKDLSLGCPAGADFAPGQARIDDCTVRVAAAGGACTASIVGTGGMPIFEESGETFAVEEVSGKDLDGKGGREIVLRTRGKDRRFGYRVVTCGAAATAPVAFENDFPARFEPTSRGRIVVVFPDDGFRDFPDFPLRDLFGEYAPDTRLMLEEGALVDVGHEYRAHFDRTIKELHDLLDPPTLRKFRAGRIEDEAERRAVAARIIRIVGSYLNSGREQDAWRELKRDWPPRDYERIHQAIAAACTRGTLPRLATRPS